MTATPEDTDQPEPHETRRAIVSFRRGQIGRRPPRRRLPPRRRPPASISDRVTAHEQEMAEKGKNVKGEGEIE